MQEFNGRFALVAGLFMDGEVRDLIEQIRMETETHMVILDLLADP